MRKGYLRVSCRGMCFLILLGCLLTHTVHAFAAPQRLGYIHDADGNRVGRWEIFHDLIDGRTWTNHVRFLIDELNPTGMPRPVAVAESDGSGGNEEEGFITLRHAILIGHRVEAIGVFDSDHGEAHEEQYLVYDGHGSVRMVGDESGDVSEFRSWEGFGQCLDLGTNRQLEYGFAGELTDSELGQVIFPARGYLPSLGRFASPDPLEGRAGEPMSHHRYLYANANPVMNADPTGSETLLGLMSSMAMRVSLAAQVLGQVGQTYLRVRIVLDTLQSLLEAYDILYTVSTEGVDGLGDESLEAASELTHRTIRGLAWRIAENILLRRIPGLSTTVGRGIPWGAQLGISRIGGRSLKDLWHPGSFSEPARSIAYHLAKHGKGRTASQYTAEAMKFFQANKRLGQRVILKDGTPGIHVVVKRRHPVSGKMYKIGGYWTEEGRLVTFWD